MTVLLVGPRTLIIEHNNCSDHCASVINAGALIWVVAVCCWNGVLYIALQLIPFHMYIVSSAGTCNDVVWWPKRHRTVRAHSILWSSWQGGGCCYSTEQVPPVPEHPDSNGYPKTSNCYMMAQLMGLPSSNSFLCIIIIIITSLWSFSISHWILLFCYDTTFFYFYSFVCILTTLFSHATSSLLSHFHTHSHYLPPLCL